MEAEVQVRQSATFRRAYKRLHPKQKADVDDAVAEIVRDSSVGETKKGDLAGVYAYEYDPESRLLLLMGSHENCYQDLKR